jgi:hypothetical protein
MFNIEQNLHSENNNHSLLEEMTIIDNISCRELESTSDPELSPPEILPGVYDGTEVVGVRHFFPNAEIVIYANDVEVGRGSFWYPDWGFKVDRLKAGDSITATQTYNGKTSAPTRDPVTVENIPDPVTVENIPNEFYDEEENLKPPTIEPPIYDCQQIVAVKDKVRGAIAEVFLEDSPDEFLGRGWTHYGWTPVRTRVLLDGEELKTMQYIGSEESFFSQPTMKVQPKPSRLSAPYVVKKYAIADHNLVGLCGLVKGAFVRIYSNGNKIGSGLAAASSQLFGVSPRLIEDEEITATQALCEIISPQSPPLKVHNKLPIPKIDDILCVGGDRIRICNTVPGASLFIFINDIQAGGGGATPGCTTLYLGNDIVLKTGDNVYVTQMVGNIETKSSTIVVSDCMQVPECEITNGIPFFEPEENDDAIPGPVYFRNTLPGPKFKVALCCGKDAKVTIYDPWGEFVKSIDLVEIYSGHFEETWDWSPLNEEPIPVGIYTAKFSTTDYLNDPSEDEKKFFVIFNPREVGELNSSAFVLGRKSETAVWFGPKIGCSRAWDYNLHLDDNRIFGRAIKEINGEIDQYSACQKLMSYEDGLFNYAENTDTADVIDLLGEKVAQCADDACMMTALLRSVGIPSHPVTADAGSEYEKAHWYFDTWSEAKMNGPYGIRWYALHTHGSLQGPTARSIAGSWSEAKRNKNDVIIFAGEDWEEDSFYKVNVKWGWNDCKPPQPTQMLTKEPWVGHICCSGPDVYWNVGHWVCNDIIEPNTKQVNISITLDKQEYYVGEIMVVNVTIDNPTGESISSDLNVHIVTHNPIYKKTPDRVLKEVDIPLTVESYGSETVLVRYEIPLTVSSSNYFIVNATFADGYAYTPFEILPLFEYETSLPDYIKEDDNFSAMLEVYNPFETSIYNIYATLKIPFEVESYDEIQTLLIDENFSGTFPPSGWSTDFWKKSNTSEAGGVVPEARVYKYDQYGGGQYYDNYIITPTIDARDYEKIVVEFKFAADTYYPDYCNFYVKYRKNDTSPWVNITPWLNPLQGDFNGSYTVSIDCGSEGCGDAFQVKWEYQGYYFYYDYFYLDDVKIKPGALVKYIEELQPDSSETLTWNLYARSPTSVAPFKFIISSENGGNIILYNGSEIFPISTKEPIENPLGPLAVLYPSKTTVKRGEEVTFNGSDSLGVDLDYFFDFGDGKNTSWTSDFIVKHVYRKKGTYFARLKVRDVYGGESFWYTVEMIVPKSKSKTSEIQSETLSTYLKNAPLLYSILKNLPRL